MAVFLLPEADCPRVIDPDMALDAVEQVFASMAKGSAWNFPVVREALGHADALYGFKSGFDRAGLALGVKSGGYWPGNASKGLTNHQSTVMLFDPDTGKLSALIGGNYLTAIRTAAAAAVSVRHLARSDARVLGMIGAGHQSAFQLRGVAAMRPFERVVAWNQSADGLDRLAATARDLGLGFDVVHREEVAAQADVIVTITSAHEPLLMADWIRPGTHLACMGTDTRGKQEIDPEILRRAAVFTDEVAQSISIGEAQHAVAQGLIASDDITPIGAVINGVATGRSHADQVTVFDGTGVALQDLAVAARAMARAKAAGLGAEVAF